MLFRCDFDLMFIAKFAWFLKCVSISDEEIVFSHYNFYNLTSLPIICYTLPKTDDIFFVQILVDKILKKQNFEFSHVLFCQKLKYCTVSVGSFLIDSRIFRKTLLSWTFYYTHTDFTLAAENATNGENWYLNH